MSKKVKILITSYVVALLVGLLGFSIAMYGSAGSYRLYNDTEYRRAMAQLVTSMEDLDSALQKGQYATGTVVTSKVCSQIYASAQSAGTALNILPLDQYELQEVAAFIAQVEDYAGAKVSQAADGTPFDDADREMSGQLAEITGELTDSLSGMYEELSSGRLTIRGPELTGLTSNVADETGPMLEDRMLDLAGQFPETPALNYEGKYSSDHEETYRVLEGLEEVTEAEALEIARELLELPEGALESMGLSGGVVPSYYFTAEQESGNITVAVTQAGGKVLLYLNDHIATEENITGEEAYAAGEAFLERAGYEDMSLYEEKYEWGLLELIYVYSADEVTSLADTVKVSVSLDDGSINSFSASEFLQNHVDHGQVEPGMKKEEAARVAIPEGITVQSADLTYYTAESGETDLCWRFRCETAEGEACLIYANADTGVQMEIVTDTTTLIM